jgi:hypothetical protein
MFPEGVVEASQQLSEMSFLSDCSKQIAIVDRQIMMCDVPFISFLLPVA